MDRTAVLYDADCGFCRWSADVLRRWDRRGVLRFAPLASDEATELLESLDREVRFASWHVVTGDGSVYSAGAAVPELLLRLPGGSAPAALARRMPHATDRAYRILAANRDRLGRMLGVRACAVDPSRPGRLPRRPRSWIGSERSRHGQRASSAGASTGICRRPASGSSHSMICTHT